MSLRWMRLQGNARCPLVLVTPAGKLRAVRFGSEAVAGGLECNQDPVLMEAARQLELYFAGELKEFDLPLAPVGTVFQRSVWQALLTIPYGETRSYSAIARQIGSEKAVRAVGAANGRNPIPIVIPCHRVIGSNGRLTGFGGGLPLKEYLLRLERSPCEDTFFPLEINSLTEA